MDKNPIDIMLEAARIDANKSENNSIESKKRWLREERGIALQEGDLEALKALDKIMPSPASLPTKTIVNNRISSYPGHIIKADNIADTWIIDDVAGTEATYLIFKDSKYSKLNDYLVMDAKRRIQEHLTITRQTQAELKNEPTVAARISNTSSCSLESLSINWVSLLCTYESYSGGAHGSLSLKSINYILDDNGNIKPFKLWDMLIKSSTNINKLSHMIISDLKHQKASDVLNGKFTANDLNKEINANQISFTVLLNGIVFHFDPYHVGTGVEGSFRTLISTSNIKSMIRPDGPLH